MARTPWTRLEDKNLGKRFAGLDVFNSLENVHGYVCHFHADSVLSPISLQVDLSVLNDSYPSDAIQCSTFVSPDKGNVLFSKWTAY